MSMTIRSPRRARFALFLYWKRYRTGARRFHTTRSSPRSRAHVASQ